MESNRKPFIANLLHRYKTVLTKNNVTQDLPYPIYPPINPTAIYFATRLTRHSDICYCPSYR